MTDTTERTYVGGLPRGAVALPGRTVPFTAGATLEFTAAEAELLDPAEWTGGKTRKTKASPASNPAAPATTQED